VPLGAFKQLANWLSGNGFRLPDLSVPEWRKSQPQLQVDSAGLDFRRFLGTASNAESGDLGVKPLTGEG
jgi:hypothetical protein